MRRWEALIPKTDEKIMEICGNTLQEACNNYARELVRGNVKHVFVLDISEAELSTNGGCPGGWKECVTATYTCRVSTCYTEDSDYYREYDMMVDVKIKASESDLAPKEDTASIIKEMRSSTGLTQAEFAKKYYDIPIGTLRDWEQGRREVSNYVIELLRFKIEHE